MADGISDDLKKQALEACLPQGKEKTDNTNHWEIRDIATGAVVGGVIAKVPGAVIGGLVGFEAGKFEGDKANSSPNADCAIDYVSHHMNAKNGFSR